MHLSSDELVLWQYGFIKLNVTIVTTWVLMLVLVAGARLVTRNLGHNASISRWQGLLEVIVVTLRKQIAEVGLRHPEKYMGFLGTLFLFIALSNLCTIFPGYAPPTGSLSTTAALALSVFVAVPLFGIAESGLRAYLRSYTKPTVIMLPFNIISHHAVHLPDRDELARPADRNGAGLYLQYPRNCLHRGGDAGA